MLSITVGLNDGWNHTLFKTSGSMTGEFSVTWTPNTVFSLVTTGYIGRDDVLYHAQQLSLLDFVATCNLTPALSLILSGDFKQTSGNDIEGDEATLHTNGFAGYVNYVINTALRISVRGEYLNYLGAGHALEGTLTAGYAPVRNFELRAELRCDRLSSGLVNTGRFYVRADPQAQGQIDANNNAEFALQGVYRLSRS